MAGLRPKSMLHGYQERAVQFAIEKTHCLLALEMGLGKTASTLTIINFLTYEDLEINRTLVIAPKRVVESVWDTEAAKWEHTKHLTFSKVIGTQKQRLQALDKKADIYLIGRDNVPWLCGLYGGNMLPFDLCVIDESSSFKNHNSVRFKSLKAVQPSFKRVIELTGTPAPNGLLDIWAPMYLLDRGKRLGKFITRYREDYFRKKYSGFGYEIRNGAEQMIYDKIGDICMSMKAKDYLDLPGRIDNDIVLQMPDDVRKMYEEFEREKVLEFLDEIEGDEKEITAINAAALANKLLQFANGAVYDELKKYHVQHNIKIEALAEIMEEAQGKPVLVAWTFKSDRDRILKELAKYKPVELKDNKTIEDWNDGKIQLLMMHPASGGHGLNLQSGGHIIVWFGQTWSLELLQQFNARVDRQGQEEIVVINKLIMGGTMDERVIASQNDKDFTQEGLMQAVKATIRKHTKNLK